MKAMQCELCGGTDIVKDDDFFVCRSCGMKYTLESAKKMMVEGVVQVEGTVKVDNSQQIQNYLEMAKKAHASSNEEEAEGYAKRVLELEPGNYEALYIKGISAGWQTSGRNNRIPEAVDYFSRALSNFPAEEDSSELKQTIASDISKLSLAMINMRCNQYANFPSEENANSIVTEASNSLMLTMKLIISCGIKPNDFQAQAASLMNAAAVAGYNQIKKDYDDGKPLQPLHSDGTAIYSSNDRLRYAHPSEYDWEKFRSRADACMKIIKAAIALDDDDDEEDIQRYENLIVIGEFVKDSCSIVYVSGGAYSNSTWCRQYSFTDDAKSSRQKDIIEWKNKKREAQKSASVKRAAKSWEGHEEEREKLVKKVAELSQSIEEAKSNAEYQEVNKKVSELEKSLSKLQSSLNACGLFAGKDKKQLKEQINAAQNELFSLGSKKKTFDARINELELSKKNIQAKLDKPYV